MDQPCRTLSPLFRMAVRAGVEGAVRLHLGRGDDVNSRDAGGMTPLMLAASRNKAGVITILLDAGADPCLLDSEGRDALEHALQAGATESILIIRTALGIHDLVPVPPVPVPDPTISDSAEDVADWEIDETPAPPEGDGGLAEASRTLHRMMSTHRALDRDESWDDLGVFLPERATAPVLAEGWSGFSILLLRGLREGSVPLSRLEQWVTLEVEERDDEDAQRIVALVLGDLGAEIDERDESGDMPFQEEPTFSEQQMIAESIAHLEGLASPRNDPINFYVRDIHGHVLLGPDEEIALGKEMEAATNEALDALVRWPEGLARLLPLIDGASPDTGDNLAFVAEAMCEVPLDENDEWPLGDAEGEKVDSDNQDDACASVVATLRQAISSSSVTEVRAALWQAGISHPLLHALASCATAASGHESAFRRAVLRRGAARERMIRANLRLAYSTAMKFMSSGIALDDLVQEGNIGLMRAVDGYDWRKGFRFSTYAIWWIRQQIMRHIENNTCLVRIPVHMGSLVRRFSREQDAITASLGRRPRLSEVAIRMDMPLAKAWLIEQLSGEYVSLDETADHIGAPIDWLSGDDGDDPLQASLITDAQRLVRTLVAGLKSREAGVLALRFGLYDDTPLTLEEVGRMSGVTRERIRQIESKALNRLQVRAQRLDPDCLLESL